MSIIRRPLAFRCKGVEFRIGGKLKKIEQEQIVKDRFGHPSSMDVRGRSAWKSGALEDLGDWATDGRSQEAS